MAYYGPLCRGGQSHGPDPGARRDFFSPFQYGERHQGPYPHTVSGTPQTLSGPLTLQQFQLKQYWESEQRLAEQVADAQRYVGILCRDPEAEERKLAFRIVIARSLADAQHTAHTTVQQQGY